MMMGQRIAYPNKFLMEYVFNATRDKALEIARRTEHEVLEPLLYLEGAECPNSNAALEGATYKSLAYVAHRMGMSDEYRAQWYNVARRISLSQAHVGCIIVRLNERDEMIAELERQVMFK
jgi:hypothetical protein